MKTRKNIRKHYLRRQKKVGGFFGKSKSVSSADCDIMNLSSLSKDMGDGQDPVNKMRENYQKCCPKDFIGRKNSSPYCKQLNMNFESLSKYKKDIAGYYGDETDVSKIKQIMRPEIMSPETTNKKPWYKPFGGKKTKRKTRKYKRKN